MKKSMKRTLALVLAIMMTLGFGVTSFAAAAPAVAVEAEAIAPHSADEENRILLGAVMLIPFIGPLIALFLANDMTAILPAFIVSMFFPLLGPLLYMVGLF